MRSFSNLLNKLFGHSKYQKIKLCDALIQDVNNCNSFKELLACHKKIFENGIVLSNLENQPHGMFRTAALQLTLDQVYLGNICGLFIRNAKYWESSKDCFARDMCMRQWQNALIANLTNYMLKLKQSET